MDITSPHLSSVLGNVVAAPLFVCLAGLVKEPLRQRLMAAFLGAAALVYLGGGLGAWEYPFAILLAALAAAGLRYYPALGVGWLVHTASDALHHASGRPMVNAMPLSSFGCAVFDPLIAIWFFAGAPSAAAMVAAARAARPSPGAASGLAALAPPSASAANYECFFAKSRIELRFPRVARREGPRRGAAGEAP